MSPDSRNRRRVKTIRALPLAARHAFSIAAHHHETEPGLAVLPEDYRQIETTIRACLRDVLGLSETRVAAFTEDTPLFGALPELDSMAVAGLLTEIEERLGILIEDDEVDGEMLESFGALVRFAVAHTPR